MVYLFIEELKSKNAKITTEKHCCLHFVREFMSEKQIVNGKFYEEVIKRLITQFIMLGLSSRKVGPGIFCTTMRRRICGALSMSV
jgi:hypothetical protein